MRQRLMAGILGTTMLITGCAGEGGPNGAAKWLGDTVDAAVGTGAAFAAQVARRGCGDNPYNGKSPIEVLALATTYTAIASVGYADGIVRAESALGLQQTTNTMMIADLDAMRGGVGLEASFSGLRQIDVNTDSAEQLAEALEERLAANPLSDDVLAELREANRSMHIGNHFQVDAAVGGVLLAAYIADALDRGGGSELGRIMLAEAGRDGRGMVDSISRSPGTLMSMVLNLGSAYSLHRTLGRVTDFDESIEALEMMGVPADISALEAVAQANARALRSRYPAELEYEANGQMVRGLLIGALERRGVSQFVSAPVLDVVFMACGGVFGGTAEVALVEPTAPLSEAEIRVAQQALIDLGYLQGRADGVPGRMTTGAVMDFQRARGLPVDGQLTRGLLGALRTAQGTRAETAAGPATRAVAPGAPQPSRGPSPEEACVTADDNAFVGGFKLLAVRVQQELGRATGTDFAADCP